MSGPGSWKADYDARQQELEHLRERVRQMEEAIHELRKENEELRKMNSRLITLFRQGYSGLIKVLAQLQQFATNIDVDLDVKLGTGHIPKEVLNADEAAEFLGVNPYTIRQKARLGEIPGRKVGKEWRFSRQALLVTIEAGSVAPEKSKLGNLED